MKTFLLAGLLCIWMVASSSAQTQADNQTSALLPGPQKNEAGSFMGMTIGSEIRAKCTDPAVDLNHARLLAVTAASITVTTSGLDELVLPREKTTVGPPVNWQVTRTVSTNRSTGWIIGCLLLITLAGSLAVGIYVWRSWRNAENELLGLPQLAANFPMEQSKEPIEQLAVES